jgi:hypothetical protein
MKKITIIIIAILFMAAPVLSYGQEENTQNDKKISYTFINEYGFYTGNTAGFTGIFINGIKFNKTQDVVGLGLGYEVDTHPYQHWSNNVEGAQTIPVFVNYRHYFPSKKRLKPLVNIGMGTRINFWREINYFEYSYLHPNEKQKVGIGLYGTLAAGFKVKALSFTSGFFLKSWKEYIFGGIEVKVGYTF